MNWCKQTGKNCQKMWYQYGVSCYLHIDGDKLFSANSKAVVDVGISVRLLQT